MAVETDDAAMYIDDAASAEGAMVGADDAGIMPGIPPIQPIPTPGGKALTPQRQSHMHWPLLIVPVPGTTLALAMGMDELMVVMYDAVAVLPMVSIARHAASLEPGLMLKRMPCSQWSAWPQ